MLLSQGRTAVANSVAGSRYVAGNAGDGDTDTRWAGASGQAVQWLRVDLGGVRHVTGVWISWATVYASAYSVQISDDASAWRTLKTVGASDGRVDHLGGLDVTGRYVRIVGTKKASNSGYSIRELKVYGLPPAGDLDSPAKKDVAMQLVSSAEKSSLDWRAQYRYIEDIGGGRGYTAGIVGFCSGTGDMLELVEEYTIRKPANPLAAYLPALREVNGTDSHTGLGSPFVPASRTAAADPVSQHAQQDERDRLYFDPAVALAKKDGLRALGQLAYFDAAVMHGCSGLLAVRAAARNVARTPYAGGGEAAYLQTFVDARATEMRREGAHSDTTRVDTAQRVFLKAGNLTLTTPLTWAVYGDTFTIR